MTKNIDPQAFPSNQNSNGMSLRDYFAAKAMQGIISNLDACLLTFEEISARAWAQADSMLKVRAE
jgi:hypothetical protein